jgi:hypothetical protein
LKKKFWRKAANGRGNGCRKNSRRKRLATASFSPLSQSQVRHRRPKLMHLRTGVGVIELTVLHGQDPQDQHWGCPVRERWGLAPHQEMSPALEDRLAFTATSAPTYQEAAALACKWGCAVSDSVLHELVRRLGAKAEAQTQARIKEPPRERQPQRAPSALAVLMVDGWQVRFRGPGWGCKKTKRNRVEWHELKTGILYRHEQAGQTAGGRGVISEKVVVRWQGPPLELGRRLHWEALRGGLGRAREKLVLGDGSPWIWNLAQDRWKGATQLLDFYHGGEHLWELGRAYRGQTDAVVRPWVEARLHQLRHGQHEAVLVELQSLKGSGGQRGKTLRREQNYFAGQARRMNYQPLAERGWPIGSGAVESACRQSQCRFKRPGQFWTASGLRHLGALAEARHNDHWDQLWSTGRG